jgi:dipeptidyl aminopeptidase/acylaminoacyl peptidase
MFEEKKQRQYGLWQSPITPISLARGYSYSDVQWAGDNYLVWLEKRSNRGVIVVQPLDEPASRDLNSEFSVRAKVGYGGGDFTVTDENVFFTDADSGSIYRQPLAYGSPKAITPAFGNAASPVVSPDKKYVLFVHSYQGSDCLAMIDSEGGFFPKKVASGKDFYMQPVWHPSGEMCAWIEWSHPNMPWDGTTLCLAKIRSFENDLPSLIEMETIAGDETTSIIQPEFSPNGKELAYISDATGWWQIYLYDLEKKTYKQMTFDQAEHAMPAWIQGNRHYAFSPDSSSLYFLRIEAGFVHLYQLDLLSGKEMRLPLDEKYTYLGQIHVSENGIALLASGGKVPDRVISFDIREDASSGEQPKMGTHIWARGTSEELSEDAYSQPEAIEWQGMDGGIAHGLFYAPQSMTFTGIDKSPLMILVHGGPTSQTYNSFNPRAQFFTSRGYAVLEVNHRGSTGYGREYRNLLRSNWGLYDVQDAVSGAKYLNEQGAIDITRVMIMGGSAGGFTVLKALEDYPGFFKAGICLYGVSNQFTLAAETHKFEQHYLDTMLGPLPQAAHIYRERSPIFFADKIQDAIAIFQGEDDVVVPKNQMDSVVALLERRGIPHIYHVYPGEGHGFRKTETIEHFYQSIEKFLQQFVIFA